MASAREIGLEVLPHFKENVLAGRVLPYGYYAKATGRDIATESMAIGQAMHAIVECAHLPEYRLPRCISCGEPTENGAESSRPM